MSDEDGLKRYRRLYGQATAQIATLQREIAELRDELRSELKKHQPPDQEAGGFPVVTKNDFAPGYKDEKLQHVGPGLQYDPAPSERPPRNAHQKNEVTPGAHWVPASEGSRLYADEQPAQPRIPNRFKRKR